MWISPTDIGAGKGSALAGINYRLSRHAVFPAQIENCKATIRWPGPESVCRRRSAVLVVEEQTL
jgi:hypothetical protein